jgi:putative glutamine amidotransferase
MPQTSRPSLGAPTVAVTATTKVIDGMPRVRLNDAYVQAIVAAGLVPLVVPPLAPDAAASVLNCVQGLVLTGGEDVDPAQYGDAPDPATQPAHGARDRCEIALTRVARDRGIPTLAICRGLQVVNVALGGTLIQDIASGCPGALQHDRSRDRAARVHRVEVAADSALAGVLGAATIDVNSSHHQSVARVADGVRVTARSPDGIVEGAESADNNWWMLGVQWHPEELVEDAEPWDRNLFAAFAAAVRGH